MRCSIDGSSGGVRAHYLRPIAAAVWLLTAGMLQAAPTAPSSPALPSDSSAPASPVERTEVEEQIERARIAGYPVLLIFSMDGCSFCSRMETEVYPLPEVRKRMDGFVTIQADFLENKELAARYAVRGVPAYVKLSPEGHPDGRAVGFMNEEIFLDFLGKLTVVDEEESALGRRPPDLLEMPANLERVIDLPGEELTAADFAAAFLAMRNPDFAPFLRTALDQKENLPRPALVSLLNHRMLAVRLGALEFLENLSGSDFGYSPWKDQPGEHDAAMMLWRQWADAGGSLEVEAIDWSDEQVAAGFLNDLISEDFLRMDRGRRHLLAAGEEALPSLELFQNRNPDLPGEGRERLREVRYAILLGAAGVSEARGTARRLVFGSLDLRLQALAVCGNGPRQLVIFRDFLQSPEPLEREAAVDQIAALRSEEAAAILIDRYPIEEDENVRHGILRRLGDLGGESALLLLAGEVASESEDLSIMALESLGKLKASSQQEAVGKALSDPRWRVRVAALKTLQEQEFTGLEKEIGKLLEDPDEFVRITAIETASKRKIRGVRGRLQEMFLAQEELRPAIAEAFVRMEIPIPKELVQALELASPDAVLAVVAALPDADDAAAPLLEWAVAHQNRDISAAAARLIASRGMSNDNSYRQLAGLLRSGQDHLVSVVLLHSTPSSYHIHGAIPETKKPRFAPVAEEVESAPEEAPNRDALHFRDAVKKQFLDTPDPAIKKAAALLLTALGDDSGLPLLQADFAQLTEPERARLADALGSSRTPTSEPLFRLLLSDPSANVRRSAVSSLLDGEPDQFGIKILMEEFEKPDSPLIPHEVFSYRISSLGHSMRGAQRKAAENYFLDQARMARNPDSRIIALSILNNFREPDFHYPPRPQEVEPALLAILAEAGRDDLPQVRRAAFLTLASLSPEELQKRIPDILQDPAPEVREVLPIHLTSGNMEWEVFFTRGSPGSANTFRWAEQEAFSQEKEQILADLENDSSEMVRNRATLSRISHRLPFRQANFQAFLQSEEAERQQWQMRSQARDIFRGEIGQLPPEYALLLSYLDEEDDPEIRKQVTDARRHFGLETEGSLPQTSEPADAKAALDAAAAEGEMILVYFSKPGCAHCDQVKSMLERLRENFPEVRVEEWNINKNRSMEFNESLSERFDVPEIQRLVAPAVFGAGGYLIQDDLSDGRLGHLVFASRNLDATFLQPEEAELEGAADAISHRYSGIQAGVIIAAGLLDGLNPCAFATIIFLLSYLQIARKSSHEILQIGLAYIAGVFTAYFLLGLGLTELITRLVVIRWMATALNLGMAAFALVIAFLSIRDGIRCLQGRMSDMTLQLPDAVKQRIHGVIRTSARHRRFVVFAFGVGAFISLLELACTGQVYAPTILYMLQGGEGRAIGYLLLYNFSFILPLAIIFGMAFFGMTSAKLTEFLKRRAALVKFALAVLFFVLAALLIGREI